MHENTSGRVRYLRPRQLAERWSCSITTLWRQQKCGRLPQPTRLSAGIVAWREDVIAQIEDQRTQRQEA